MSKVVYEIFAKDFSLSNALWSDTPVEVDSNKIEMLIENNQQYTT